MKVKILNTEGRQSFIDIMQSISDDVKIMLGHLQLSMAGEIEHTILVRQTAFYLSTLYGYLNYASDNDKEEELIKPDLETLKNLHKQVLEMQKNIAVGLGSEKQQWKKNLSILSDIYFEASQIAIKYDMIRYEIGQFAEFKNSA